MYLLPVPPQGVALTQLVLHTFYAGGHPTSILSDSSHEGFELRARVVMWSPAPTSGTIVLSIPDVAGATASVQGSVPAGTSNFTVVIPASATKGVRLWHPRGNGEQFRYNVSATWQQSGGGTAAAAGSQQRASGSSQQQTTSAAAAPTAWRLLGFRHVALVTINDTDTAAVAAAKDEDGTVRRRRFWHSTPFAH